MDNAVAAKTDSNNSNNNNNNDLSKKPDIWPVITSNGGKKTHPSSYISLSPISIPIQRGFNPPQPLFEHSTTGYDDTVPEGVEVPPRNTDNFILRHNKNYSIDSSIMANTTDDSMASSAPVRIPHSGGGGGVGGLFMDPARVKTPSPNAKSSSGSLRSRLHRSSTANGGSNRSRRASSIPVSSSSYSNDSSPASQFLGLFASAAVPSTTQPDDPGQQVGRYVLGRILGYGGCSIVREASTIDEVGKETTLAVKIVRQNPECERIQADFDREISIWKGLNHPNILSLFEVIETDFATFAFIPIITGGTLYDVVKKQRHGIDNLSTVLSYAYDLSSALLYLHKIAGIVHRDVKLENCLLQPQQGNDKMKLLLSDFGLSEYINDLNLSSYSATPLQTPTRSGSLVHLNSSEEYGGDTSFSSATTTRPSSPNLSRTSSTARLGYSDTSTFRVGDTILGSLPYTAPEVLKELYKKESNEIKTLGDAGINPAVDIWAFGVVLFALIVGDLPFNHTFAPKLSKMILEAKIDMERVKLRLIKYKLHKTQSDAILQLLHACLEPRVEKRWTIDQVYNSTALSYR